MRKNILEEVYFLKVSDLSGLLDVMKLFASLLGAREVGHTKGKRDENTELREERKMNQKSSSRSFITI